MDLKLIRRIIVIVIVILFSAAVLIWIAMTSLPVGRLFYSLGLKPKTPYDYPGSHWVCADPAIDLAVSMTPRGSDGSTAYLTIKGEKTPIVIVIDGIQGAMLIYRSCAETEHGVAQEYFLLEGEILDISENRIIFSVTKDYCFSGEYTSITLERCFP